MESIQINSGLFAWDCFCGESGMSDTLMIIENADGEVYYCPKCGMDTVNVESE